MHRATLLLVPALVLAAACGSGDSKSSPTSAPRAETPRGASTSSSVGTPSSGASAPASSGTPSDGNAPGIPELHGQIVTTASGLRYIDETVGTGPSPTASKCVTVNYAGWLTNGTKFDASADHGGAATFPLSGVIAGWTEGLQSMKEGGKRRLIIPGNLAYGPRGQPGAGIGPNATLIFDVELVKVGADAVNTGGRPACPR